MMLYFEKPNCLFMSDRKKTVLLLFILGTLLFFVCGSNFLRYYVFKNFTLYTFTACNQLHDKCFLSNQEHSGFSFYNKPYKKVKIVAHKAPSCLNEHTCDDFSCTDNDTSCTITFCSLNSVEKGEVCSNLNQSN